MKSQKIMFLLVFGLLLLNPGCAHQITKKDDPTREWAVCNFFDPIYKNKTILEDCMAYVKTLPPQNQKGVDFSNFVFVCDNKGHHAVHINIPVDGTHQVHVLIYGVNNERIQTFHYSDGNYGI